MPTLRIPLFLLVSLISALFYVACYRSSHAAPAFPPERVALNQESFQPTPPVTTETQPFPTVQPTHNRPYPTIIGKVIAPAPRKPIVTARTALPPQWESPVGPASNWQDKETYLLLVTDRRAGEGVWRTDTIMLVGIDRAQGQAVVFSIPRDLYVNIPGYGMGRINQADALGERNPDRYGSGPALLSSVLSQTIGVEATHWVRFQMDGFSRVVDAIGGVNVYLDCPFAEPIFNLTTNTWEYFTLPAGDNWMDGDTAYWFLRLRLRSSDIDRAQRQRQFLWALRNQMLNTNLITRFPELWSAFSDSFSTDLSLIELINLTRLGLSFDTDNVRAGGLSLADLTRFRTEQGADVLGIGDPGHVRAVVNGVWNAQPMAASNRSAPEQCRPLPIDVPQMNPAITGIYAPEASVPVTTTAGANPEGTSTEPSAPTE